MPPIEHLDIYRNRVAVNLDVSASHGSTLCLCDIIHRPTNAVWAMVKGISLTTDFALCERLILQSCCPQFRDSLDSASILDWPLSNSRVFAASGLECPFAPLGTEGSSWFVATIIGHHHSFWPTSVLQVVTQVLSASLLDFVFDVSNRHV